MRGLQKDTIAVLKKPTGGAEVKLYGGVDLHSNNNWIGIINKKEKRIFTKKLPNELPEILNALKPFVRIWQA